MLALQRRTSASRFAMPRMHGHACVCTSRSLSSPSSFQPNLTILPEQPVDRRWQSLSDQPTALLKVATATAFFAGSPLPSPLPFIRLRQRPNYSPPDALRRRWRLRLAPVRVRPSRHLSGYVDQLGLPPPTAFGPLFA
jgi:hypothetical protein